MHNELKLANSSIAHFLQRKLPQQYADWWEKHVVDCLGYEKQRVNGERIISSLWDLDFSTPLSVLNRNLYDLAGKSTLPREARNSVKEFQTVRDKPAQMSAEETPASQVCRDADTLGRQLVLIGVDESSASAIQCWRSHISK